VFRTLRWGQTFEQQVIDILASPDSTREVTADRLQRAFDLYRREVWAPTEPSDVRSPTELFDAAPASGRILAAGSRLFALAAEDLAASDFGEQRWKVRQTVQEFDASYTAGAILVPPAIRTSAPTLDARYPNISEALDRLARFRVEVFSDLLGSGDSVASRQARASRLRDVALRWRIPAAAIDAR
jgi:hypothetical protein